LARVTVDDVPVTKRQPNFTYLFQQPRLLPWHAVRENQRFGLGAETGKHAAYDD
jgi:ABC-type nitrate/sulfonate/bicarbonate transport system ATPase subunit